MARKLINTKEITYDQWLEYRKQSLGGSEISAILGMNPYSSALTVYAEKKGMSKPKEDNEAMRLGRDLEQYVAERYMEVTGKKVRNDFYMYQDDTYDFMTANIDRRIVGENAGLECKVMGHSAGSYDLTNGEVPSQYYAQCQWYAMILGFERVDLAILVLQRGIEVVPIARDDEFIADMRQQAIDFWTNYVEQNRIPAPDGSEASIETLKQLYPDAHKNTEIAIPGLDAMVRDYKALKEMADDYSQRAEKQKAMICARLGSNEVGLGDSVGVSWKKQSRSKVDEQRLKADLPAIYAKYQKVSEYRVFRTRQLTKKHNR